MSSPCLSLCPFDSVGIAMEWATSGHSGWQKSWGDDNAWKGLDSNAMEDWTEKDNKRRGKEDWTEKDYTWKGMGDWSEYDYDWKGMGDWTEY